MIFFLVASVKFDRKKQQISNQACPECPPWVKPLATPLRIGITY